MVQWLGLGTSTGVRSLAGELRSGKLCSPVEKKKKRPEGHVYTNDPHASSSCPACPTTTLPPVPDSPPATPQLRCQKVNSSPHYHTSSFLCPTWLVVSITHTRNAGLIDSSTSHQSPSPVHTHPVGLSALYASILQPLGLSELCDGPLACVAAASLPSPLPFLQPDCLS